MQYLGGGILAVPYVYYLYYVYYLATYVVHVHLEYSPIFLL